MATKRQNKRTARKTAMQYHISDTSAKRDSMSAAKRYWGSGGSL